MENAGMEKRHYHPKSLEKFRCEMGKILTMLIKW